MYYIDSWAWIEYFRGSPDGRKAAPYINSHETLLTNQLTLFEVYHRICREGRIEMAEEKYRKITGEFNAMVQEIDDELTKHASHIKLKEGLAMADAYAMATARKHGAKIVTGDPDFKKFKETIYIGR